VLLIAEVVVVVGSKWVVGMVAVTADVDGAVAAGRRCVGSWELGGARPVHHFREMPLLEFPAKDSTKSYFFYVLTTVQHHPTNQKFFHRTEITVPVPGVRSIYCHAPCNK